MPTESTPRLIVELNSNHHFFDQLFTIITCLKKMFLEKNIALLVIRENSRMGSKHLIKIGSNGNGKGGKNFNSIDELRSYFRTFVADHGFEPTLINPCFEINDE
jgi:hypothetical protein